jgi:serine/threonine protein phosphatase PrpC
MLNILTHVATRPKPGETECGDFTAVVRYEHRCLVAVADGLGHGPLAAQAARAAVNFVAADPWRDLPDLLRRADRALLSTRGAALTVVRFDTLNKTMAYAGVGNVELTALSRSSIRPINTPGFIGGRFRAVHESSHSIDNGDLILLFTDGVSSRFPINDFRNIDVVTTASAVLAKFAKQQDDSTCVAIRVNEMGAQPGR